MASSWLAGSLGQWSFNKKVSDLKKEVSGMFGGGDDSQPPMYLEDEGPEVRYNKEEHRSYTAKRADAAHAKAAQGVKSDAVQAAMERRAAAKAAAAAKSRQ